MKRIFTIFWLMLSLISITGKLKSQNNVDSIYYIMPYTEDQNWNSINSSTGGRSTDIIFNQDGSKIITGFSYCLYGHSNTDSLRNIDPNDVYFDLFSGIGNTRAFTDRLIDNLPRDISYVYKLNKDYTIEWFHFVERRAEASLDIDAMGNVYCLFNKHNKNEFFRRDSVVYSTNNLLFKIDRRGELVNIYPLGQEVDSTSIVPITTSSSKVSADFIKVDNEGNYIFIFSPFPEGLSNATSSLSYLVGNQTISQSISENNKMKSLIVKTDNNLNIIWHRTQTKRTMFFNKIWLNLFFTLFYFNYCKNYKIKLN